MVKLIANTYGRAKAARFRARFSLTTENIDREYIDAHDYLHTVLGVIPVMPDEMRVLELEERLLAGTVKLKGVYVSQVA